MKPRILGLHHDHIDGSMAVREVILELYRLAGRVFPFGSVEEWLARSGDPHEDIVKQFDVVTSVVQTKEALELLAYNYGRLRAGQGYRYVEGKFAPQYHTRGGLSAREVAAAVYGGLKRAEREFGIILVPVICIGREAEPALGVEIAGVACEYEGEMILDLVCDEAEHPPEKHLPAYRYTFGTKVIRDCHAGEWVRSEPAATYEARLMKNLKTAIFELRCHSVGHAIPLGNNPDLIDFVAEFGIRVAGCPLSNLRSGLVKSLADLHIDLLLDRGVIYTLNPDDDLFLPPMETVIAECDAAYGFTESERDALEANVWRGALGLASH